MVMIVLVCLVRILWMMFCFRCSRVVLLRVLIVVLCGLCVKMEILFIMLGVLRMVMVIRLWFVFILIDNLLVIRR